MIENSLYFIHNETSYRFVGQPSNYYYDLGLIPLDNKPCSNILEKTRFLFALWELFYNTDNSNFKSRLPKPLLYELTTYFTQYDAPDLAYWSLLEYETLKQYNTIGCPYSIDRSRSNLILLAEEISIVVPKPYENIIAEDSEGKVYEIDESNFKEFKLLTYSDDNDFPKLFMSEEQEKINDTIIEHYFEQIISIFKKHDQSINNCKELAELYQRI